MLRYPASAAMILIDVPVGDRVETSKYDLPLTSTVVTYTSRAGPLNTESDSASISFMQPRFTVERACNALQIAHFVEQAGASNSARISSTSPITPSTRPRSAAR